jgi:hypothetical protein
LAKQKLEISHLSFFSGFLAFITATNRSKCYNLFLNKRFRNNIKQTQNPPSKAVQTKHSNNNQKENSKRHRD